MKIAGASMLSKKEVNSAMTKAESEFLSILKNAVHPDSSFTIASPDWNSIINTARKQNLFPLIFDASSSLPGYETIEEQYFNSVAAQMSAQAQQTADFLSLYQSFLEDGLSPIVMKGIICRSLYGERADFRASGDEDVLVSKEDYQKAVHTLNRCGYQTTDEPDSSLELIQEVTFSNPESPLTIELHLNPFGSGDHIRTDMNNWFKDVYDSQETVVIDKVPVRTLEPTDHMLFLIFHAFKHFIYGGFGVRLMMDILLSAEKYDSRIDWEYINQALTAVGATTFYSDLVSIGNQYLGFNLSILGQINTPDELLNDMFRMGTFGNTTTADHVAAQFTSDAVQRGNRRQSKFSRMFQRLFPSWQSWTAWYPYLKDKPWMVVPEWFKRLVRYLRGQADMGSMKEINEGYSVAERRLELLKKYGVI